MAIKAPLSSNMRSGWKGWRRKNGVGSKASQTPGKSKSPTCQTDATKKFFASSPKAYKHKQYGQWHENFKSINGSKPQQEQRK